MTVQQASYILVVEDDYLQADWICGNLRLAFPKTKVERITTELAFRSILDDIANNRPDLVIIDIMLRWADPAPDLKPPPDEVISEGFYRAGLRCERLLAEREATKDIPVILYSVLGRADLPFELQDLRGNVAYIGKHAGPAELAKVVRQFTTNSN